MLTGALAFIKSIPGMIITAIIVALACALAYMALKNSNLETSLAKSAALIGALKQSNTSLELDNSKKQKEFEAALAEQQGIAKNDQALIDKATQARKDADALRQQQDEVLARDPDSFVEQVNRDFACVWEGYNHDKPTCIKLETPIPATR